MRRINKIVAFGIMLVGILPAWSRVEPALITDKAHASVNQAYALGITLGSPLTFTNNPTRVTGNAYADTVPSIYTNLLSGTPQYVIGGSGIGGGFSFLNAWAGDPTPASGLASKHFRRCAKTVLIGKMAQGQWLAYEVA